MADPAITVIPCLEIKEGKCVSLERGRTDQPIFWPDEPVAKAQEFAAAGVPWIHVTDIDGLHDSPANTPLIQAIIRRTGTGIQLGGGLRSLSRIADWMEWGVGRIVVGTLAVLDPEQVKSLAKSYPDQIIVAMDIWQGRVLIHGWTEPSVITPHDFVRAYAGSPLAAILMTDIDADIEDRDRDLERLALLADASTVPLIASGVVHAAADVRQLRKIPNVTGAIVGTALFRKHIDLQDILQEAR